MSAAAMHVRAAPVEPLRVAFAGTAHVHARDYVEACTARGGVWIVGACLVDADSPYRLHARASIHRGAAGGSG